MLIGGDSLGTWHANSFAKSSDSHVCVEIGGGLGNQLFGLTAGLWAAHARRVGLTVDIGPSRPTSLAKPERGVFSQRDFELDALNLPSAGDGKPVHFVDLPYRPPLKGEMRLRRYWSRMGLPSREYWPIPWVRDDRILEVAANRKLRGNFHSWAYLYALRALGVELSLSVHSPSSWVRSMIPATTGSGVIGLHLRLGDYSRALPKLISTPQYLRQALSAARGDNPRAEVWLFSDEPLVAKSMMEDILPASQFRLVNQPESVRTADVLDLLRRCDVVICSASSFSLWAGQFAAESTHVIVPETATDLFGRSALPVKWTVISQ